VICISNKLVRCHTQYEGRKINQPIAFFPEVYKHLEWKQEKFHQIIQPNQNYERILLQVPNQERHINYPQFEAYHKEIHGLYNYMPSDKTHDLKLTHQNKA
jgi:hypothetical protein